MLLVRSTMPTRLRAHEREFPQEETVALGQFCGESIGSLRVLPSCHSSPLRDAPGGSVGAAIGGKMLASRAREREEGGSWTNKIGLYLPGTPNKSNGPRCIPHSPPATGVKPRRLPAL